MIENLKKINEMKKEISVTIKIMEIRENVLGTNDFFENNILAI